MQLGDDDHQQSQHALLATRTMGVDVFRRAGALVSYQTVLRVHSFVSFICKSNWPSLVDSLLQQEATTLISNSMGCNRSDGGRRSSFVWHRRQVEMSWPFSSGSTQHAFLLSSEHGSAVGVVEYQNSSPNCNQMPTTSQRRFNKMLARWRRSANEAADWRK